MTRWSPLGEKDKTIVEAQMAGRRFSSETAFGVAKRCRHGAPQVILCRPLKGGLPFPTLLWLTCPWLVKTLGTLESLGGVQSLEEALKKAPDGPAQWRRYQALYSALRRSFLPLGQQGYLCRHKPALWRSLVRGGVGGIQSRSPAVKCLHLQTGAWLGLGWHPGGRWLREHLPVTECDDGRCMKGPCQNASFRV